MASRHLPSRIAERKHRTNPWRVCLKCGHDDRGRIDITGLCPRCASGRYPEPVTLPIWESGTWSVWRSVQPGWQMSAAREQVGVYTGYQAAWDALMKLAVAERGKRGRIVELQPGAYVRVCGLLGGRQVHLVARHGARWWRTLPER